MSGSSPSGDPGFAWRSPADEWDAIALNFTSGTTGDPKGVVYHHRGAICSRLATFSPGRWAITRSISGRCPCSIATVGVFLGQ